MNISSLGYKDIGTKVASFFTKIINKDVTFDPPSLATGVAAVSSAIPVTGVKFGDRIIIFPPTTYTTQGVEFTGFVDAVDSVKIISRNPTGGTIDLASGTFTIQAIRK